MKILRAIALSAAVLAICSADSYEFGKSEIFAAGDDGIAISSANGAVSVDFARINGADMSVINCKGGENAYKCEVITGGESYCQVDNSCKTAPFEVSVDADGAQITAPQQSAKMPKIREFKIFEIKGEGREERKFVPANSDEKALIAEEMGKNAGQSAAASDDDIASEMSSVQSVIYANDALSVVLTASSMYMQGMAHPMSSETYATIAADGHEISLNELFSDTGALLNAANTALRRDFADVIFDDASFKEISTFFIRKGEFVVVSQNYEVAPYSAGNLQVRVPLEQIKNIIKPDALKYFE